MLKNEIEDEINRKGTQRGGDMLAIGRIAESGVKKIGRIRETGAFLFATVGIVIVLNTKVIKDLLVDARITTTTGGVASKNRIVAFHEGKLAVVIFLW